MNPFPNIYESRHFESRFFTVRKYRNKYAINWQGSGVEGLWKSEEEMSRYVKESVDSGWHKRDLKIYKLVKAL